MGGTKEQLKIMKARLINTRFWSDNFIQELNPLDRYLFLYLLTNEHANISGVYELPLKTMAFESGMEIDMVKKMLKRLVGKIFYIDGWVCIKNFQKHQSQSEDVKTGISREMANIPISIREKIEKEYKKETVVGVCIDPVGDLTKPNLTKPNLTAEVNSADISLIIKSFELINPACKKFYNNITQRRAAESVLISYGLKRVLVVIEKTLPKTNTMEFFPTITTPSQLNDKWATLESAVKRYQSKSQKLKSNVAF